MDTLSPVRPKVRVGTVSFFNVGMIRKTRASHMPLLTANHMARRPYARRNGAVDSGAVAVQISSLTGEIERVRDRCGESFARGQLPCRYIAIGAAKERVGVPVVKMRGQHRKRRDARNPLQ